MAAIDIGQTSRRTLRRGLIPSRKQLAAWLFLAPAIVTVMALVLYPLGFATVVSFYDYDLVRRVGYFIGWENFQSLLDGPYLQSSAVTLTYLVPSVTIELVFGIGLAVLLQARALGKARPIILAVIMMPMLMAPVVAGATVKLLLNPDIGLLSMALGGLDILGNRSLAMVALIVMDIWMWTPFVVLLVSAALLGISPEILEAAELDGATRWQRFHSIILPLMRPIVVIVVLFRLIDTVKVADIPYIMTQGGPGSATNVLSLLIYRTSFGTFNIGLGAAMSVVLVLALMIPVTLLYRAISRGGKP